MNLEQLKESFKELENFAPEKLETLIGETIKAFHFIQSKIESPLPKDREEALQIAADLKESLELQASALCNAIGMNQDELDSYVKDPSNFSTEENRAIQFVTQELNQFKKEIETNEIQVPKKTRKTAAAWVHG